MHGKRVRTADELKEAVKHGLVEPTDRIDEIEDELDVDLDHDMLPDPDEEMRTCMMNQIHALEKKVAALEERLAAEKEHA